MWKPKKKEIICIFIIFSILCFWLCGCQEDVVENSQDSEPEKDFEIVLEQNETISEDDLPVFRVDSLAVAVSDNKFDIKSYYCKVRETVANKYWIDENGVLWGTGYNDYGQLGNGKVDEIGVTQEEPVRIAESVVSVDTSVNGYFMIYLTADGDLYGVGSNRLGLLGQPYEVRYSDDQYEKITKPVLLMQNVSYASAGITSITALKADGTVWFWGEYKSLYLTKSSSGQYENYWKAEEDDSNPAKVLYNYPKQIMDNCIYAVTGNTHGAAITKDGELYTWGLNVFGDCGVELGDDDYVRRPSKVLDNVYMVWPEKIDMRGLNHEYRIDSYYRNVYNFNIFAILNDGTIMAAGKGIGDKQKTIGLTGDLDKQSTEYCSDQFIKVKLEEFPEVECRRKLENLKWGKSMQETEEYLTEQGIEYFEDTFAPVIGTEDEYTAKELVVENSAYCLKFDDDRNLCRIYLQMGGSRDGRFQIGMTYDEIEKNAGVELIREKSEAQGSAYRIEEPIDGIYYGFLIDESNGKLKFIIESSDEDVFASEL